MSGILYWFVFTASLALFPLVWKKLSGQVESWDDFWESGEVLLVACAFSAGAMGELISIFAEVPSVIFGQYGVLFSANFLVAVCCAFIYSDFTNSYKRKKFTIQPVPLAQFLLVSSIALTLLAKVSLPPTIAATSAPTSETSNSSPAQGAIVCQGVNESNGAPVIMRPIEPQPLLIRSNRGDLASGGSVVIALIVIRITTDNMEAARRRD